MYCLCQSRQVLKWDTGEDAAVPRTSRRKRWSAPMRAEGVGVNCDSPVSESNKPPCDTAVTGQPDNATQRAKQIGLSHRVPIAHYALGNHKTNDHRHTGATDSLSWHIVIYIIIIYHVWCGSLIYWLVFGLCVTYARLKTRGNRTHSHISAYGPPCWLRCCQC